MLPHLRREHLVARKKSIAGLRRHDEARRDRHPQAGHVRKICTLAAEQRPDVLPRAARECFGLLDFAERVDPLDCSGIGAPPISRAESCQSGGVSPLFSATQRNACYWTLPKTRLMWNGHCQHLGLTWRRPGRRDEIASTASHFEFRGSIGVEPHDRAPSAPIRLILYFTESLGSRTRELRSFNHLSSAGWQTRIEVPVFDSGYAYAMSRDRADQTVAHLGAALSESLAVITQLFLHASILKARGHPLASRYYQEWVETMRRSDNLLQGILVLGGRPASREPARLDLGREPRRILELDIALGERWVAALRATAADCAAEGSDETASMLRELHDAESASLDWRRSQWDECANGDDGSTTSPSVDGALVDATQRRAPRRTLGHHPGLLPRTAIRGVGCRKAR